MFTEHKNNSDPNTANNNNAATSAPIPVPTVNRNNSSPISDADSGYGSPPDVHSLVRMKDPMSKPNEIGDTGFYKADGKREFTKLELEQIRLSKIVIIMVSMAGRTFEPAAKNQTRDNSYPERIATHARAAAQKSLPVAIGLAAQWLNIVRAYVPVGPTPDAVLKDCFDKDGNFSERLNLLKKEIYARELERREIDISPILNAESEEAQKKLFEDLVESPTWKNFTKEMAEIGIKVPTLVSRIEEPEPDFSWKGFIHQVDATLLGDIDFTSKHPALKDTITEANLTSLVKLLKKCTGLTEQWIYYLLAIFSDDLPTIKKLNSEWYNSWENTQTSSGEKEGMKKTIMPIVRSLTNGQALFAGYLAAMAMQYQELEWFAYRHKFDPPLPITAFGPGRNWASATRSSEYADEYEKYCASMVSGNGAAGTLDDSVNKTFLGGVVQGAGYDSTTEYTTNFEKAAGNEQQEKLLRARCKMLTRMHQIEENVTVLTLPHFMPDINPQDPSQGKRRPIVFYPFNKDQGWEAPGTIIHNYHKLMDSFELQNPPKTPPKILRAEFGVLKSKTTKTEEIKKSADTASPQLKDKTAPKQKEKESKKNAGKPSPSQHSETMPPTQFTPSSSSQERVFAGPTTLETNVTQDTSPRFTQEQLFFNPHLAQFAVQFVMQYTNSLPPSYIPASSAQLNMSVPQQTLPQNVPPFFPGGYVVVYPQPSIQQPFGSPPAPQQFMPLAQQSIPLSQQMPIVQPIHLEQPTQSAQPQPAPSTQTNPAHLPNNHTDNGPFQGLKA